MIRVARSLLMSTAAAAAALSLAAGGIVAEEEGALDEMASAEPMMGTETGLHVTGAWARPSPMLDLAGAAYMVIHNDTDADDALIGASSPVAEFVELHLSSMDEEGMMSMQQVSEIAVPAEGEAVLEPGSYHIMLIDLVEPLELDTDFELSLEFRDSEPQTISVPVQAGMPMAGAMDGMGDDGTDMDGMGDDVAMDTDDEPVEEAGEDAG